MTYSSDYYAALLRTRQDFVAPTQGKLLNYVQRVPLGVVAQITVCHARYFAALMCFGSCLVVAIQPPATHSYQEDRSRVSCRQLYNCEAKRISSNISARVR